MAWRALLQLCVHAIELVVLHRYVGGRGVSAALLVVACGAALRAFVWGSLEPYRRHLITAFRLRRHSEVVRLAQVHVARGAVAAFGLLGGLVTASFLRPPQAFYEWLAFAALIRVCVDLLLQPLVATVATTQRARRPLGWMLAFDSFHFLGGLVGWAYFGVPGLTAVVLLLSLLRGIWVLRLSMATWRVLHLGDSHFRFRHAFTTRDQETWGQMFAAGFGRATQEVMYAAALALAVIHFAHSHVPLVLYLCRPILGFVRGMSMVLVRELRQLDDDLPSAFRRPLISALNRFQRRLGLGVWLAVWAFDSSVRGPRSWWDGVVLGPIFLLTALLSVPSLLLFVSGRNGEAAALNVVVWGSWALMTVRGWRDGVVFVLSLFVAWGAASWVQRLPSKLPRRRWVGLLDWYESVRHGFGGGRGWVVRFAPQASQMQIQIACERWSTQAGLRALTLRGKRQVFMHTDAQIPFDQWIEQSGGYVLSIDPLNVSSHRVSGGTISDVPLSEIDHEFAQWIGARQDLGWQVGMEGAPQLSHKEWRHLYRRVLSQLDGRRRKHSGGAWEAGILWREGKLCRIYAWSRALDGSRRLEWSHRLRTQEAAVDLIRFRGHSPREGYDVHDGRYEAETNPTQLH
jgi:hypothetical protein